jgi:CheY-like chemotaxis protein
MISHNLIFRGGNFAGGEEFFNSFSWSRWSVMSILIVDDCLTLRILLRLVCQNELGLQVFEASNGAEALALVAKNQPRIIITDSEMPDMDGLALCEALAADPRAAKIPVIMFSANPVPAHVRHGLAAAVHKSDIERLVEVVKEQLAALSNRQSLSA